MSCSVHRCFELIYRSMNNHIDVQIQPLSSTFERRLLLVINSPTLPPMEGPMLVLNSTFNGWNLVHNSGIAGLHLVPHSKLAGRLMVLN